MRRSWRDVDPRAIGARVRDRRHALGLTQRELAFLGCSYAYLSRIEAGERTPSGHLLEELARRLGVTKAWLERGDDAVVVTMPGDVAKAVAAWISDGLRDAWCAVFEDHEPSDLSPVEYAVLPAVLHLLDDEDREAAEDLLAGEVIVR